MIVCYLLLIVWSLGFPWNRKEIESLSVVSDSLQPYGLYSPWDSPGQNTGVGSLSLLQWIFPTQGLNPGLPHCRQILYQLNHKGSPGILEWIAYPFSSGSSQPRNRTGVSCIAGGFFTNWAMVDCNSWKHYKHRVLWSQKFSIKFDRYVLIILKWEKLCML